MCNDFFKVFGFNYVNCISYIVLGDKITVK
jgi:hypothetical protein